MRLFRVVLAFVFLAAPVPVYADAITLLAAARAVFAEAAVVPVNPFGTPLYNQPVLTTEMKVDTANGSSAAVASLTSVIDAGTGQFSGQGSTSLSHTSTTVASGGHTQVDYGVAFELTEPQYFVFAADVLVSGAHTSSRSLWFADLFTYPTEETSISSFQFWGRESGDLQASGLLLPGQYKFSFGSSSSSFFAGTGGSATAFTFNLSVMDPAVAATPEPASMVLLGTGVLGILARRRIRNRRNQSGPAI
jgi:hypothetical protein